MRCGVYSLRANYTQTIHEAYIERQRDKETKSGGEGESKRLRVKETKSGGDKGTKRQSLPQPLPKGKGFVAALMHRTWGSFFGDKETESERRKDRLFETLMFMNLIH